MGSVHSVSRKVEPVTTHVKFGLDNLAKGIKTDLNVVEALSQGVQYLSYLETEVAKLTVGHSRESRAEHSKFLEKWADATEYTLETCKQLRWGSAACRKQLMVLDTAYLLKV